jgi:hypothetical protein
LSIEGPRIVANEPTSEDWGFELEPERPHVDEEPPAPAAADVPAAGDASPMARMQRWALLGVVGTLQLAWVVLVVVFVWWLISRVAG